MSLAVLGTADKEPISEDLMQHLKKEFEPTYAYLGSIGFANVYE